MAEEYWKSSPFGKNSVFHSSWDKRQKEERDNREKKGGLQDTSDSKKQIGGVFYTSEGIRLGEVLINKNVFVVSKKIIDDKGGIKRVISNINEINNAINRSKNQLVIDKGINDLNNYLIKYSRDTRMIEEELNLRICLAILKQAEAGSRNIALDYNSWNGGYFFTEKTYKEAPEDYANHPGRNKKTGNSASGAYQFLKRFYDESTFSPENQDKAAVKNMTSNSYKSALSGNIEAFKKYTSSRWVSLDYWSQKQLETLYLKYIIDELNGNSKIATSIGLLLLIRNVKK